MPGATSHGYPYPIVGDTMGTWPTTGQNLANELEAKFHGSYTTPSLAAGWSAYTSGPGYRKEGGRVALQGGINSATAGKTGNIFTLPAGFRPVTPKFFTVLAYPGLAYIAIQTTGAVDLISYMASGVATSLIAFDQISFPIA